MLYGPSNDPVGQTVWTVIGVESLVAPLPPYGDFGETPAPARRDRAQHRRGEQWVREPNSLPVDLDHSQHGRVQVTGGNTGGQAPVHRRVRDDGDHAERVGHRVGQDPQPLADQASKRVRYWQGAGRHPNHPAPGQRAGNLQGDERVAA
jgi:hypothetical protein